MNSIDKEVLISTMEFNIEKAEHVAENLIENRKLDAINTNMDDDLEFARNRNNIWIEMEILVDYIKSIKAGADALREAVLS